MNKRQAKKKKKKKRRTKDEIEYLTDMFYKHLGINKDIVDRYTKIINSKRRIKK